MGGEILQCLFCRLISIEIINFAESGGGVQELCKFSWQWVTGMITSLYVTVRPTTPTYGIKKVFH